MWRSSHGQQVARWEAALSLPRAAVIEVHSTVGWLAHNTGSLSSLFWEAGHPKSRCYVTTCLVPSTRILRQTLSICSAWVVMGSIGMSCFGTAHQCLTSASAASALPVLVSLYWVLYQGGRTPSHWIRAHESRVTSSAWNLFLRPSQFK